MPGRQFEHFQAKSITELEMFKHYRGLCTQEDIDALLRERIIAEVNGQYVLTRIAAQYDKKRKT